MPQKSPPAFLDYDQTTFDPAYDYAAYPPKCSRGPPPSAAIRRLLTQQLAPGGTDSGLPRTFKGTGYSNSVTTGRAVGRPTAKI